MKINRFSLVLTLAIVAIAVLFSTPFSYALESGEILLEAYEWTNYDGGGTMIGNNYAGFGQYFEADATGYISNITVYLKRTGSPQGYINCTLFGTGGSYPNSTVYALSTTELYALDVATSYTNYTFTFNMTYQVQIGEAYCFGIQYINETNVDVSNYISIGRDDNSGAGMEGSMSQWDSSPPSWSALSNLDLVFEIAGTETEGGEEEEEENDFWLDDSIESFVNFAVPLGVCLAPLYIFVVMGKVKPTKWIVIICLTIGFSLGYIFMDIPIWTVFLMAVAIAGFAYSDIRKG